jgi:hypothetical protein
MITEQDLEAGEQSPVLGPAYFAARRAAEGVMQGMDDEPIKAVAKKAAELVKDELYDYIEAPILGDLECNVQGHIYRIVDDTVQALLTGQAWAIERYALAQRYDAVAVREAVARHGGESLQAARVADLEKQVADLKQSLQWEREMRSRY